MPIIKSPEELNYDFLEKLYESKVFEDFSTKEIKSLRYEEIKVSTDRLTFKLIDKQQRDLISLIHGEKRIYNDTEYFEIVWTYSKSPKQGHLTYLFEVLIYEFDYKIISDRYHTSPGSKEFWQSQIRKKKFNIYRLDLDSNYKRKAEKFNESQIWDVSTIIDDELIQEVYNPEDFTNETYYDNDENDYQNQLINSVSTDDYALPDYEIEFVNPKKNRMERIRLIAQKLSLNKK